MTSPDQVRLQSRLNEALNECLGDFLRSYPEATDETVASALKDAAWDYPVVREQLEAEEMACPI